MAGMLRWWQGGVRVAGWWWRRWRGEVLLLVLRSVGSMVVAGWVSAGGRVAPHRGLVLGIASSVAIVRVPRELVVVGVVVGTSCSRGRCRGVVVILDYVGLRVAILREPVLPAIACVSRIAPTDGEVCYLLLNSVIDMPATI